jgi:hypothetical protein
MCSVLIQKSIVTQSSLDEYIPVIWLMHMSALNELQIILLNMSVKYRHGGRRVEGRDALCVGRGNAKIYK